MSKNKQTSLRLLKNLRLNRKKKIRYPFLSRVHNYYTGISVLNYIWYTKSSFKSHLIFYINIENHELLLIYIYIYIYIYVIVRLWNQSFREVPYNFSLSQFVKWSWPNKKLTYNQTSRLFHELTETEFIRQLYV